MRIGIRLKNYKFKTVNKDNFKVFVESPLTLINISKPRKELKYDVCDQSSSKAERDGLLGYFGKSKLSRPMKFFFHYISIRFINFARKKFKVVFEFEPLCI